MRRYTYTLGMTLAILLAGVRTVGACTCVAGPGDVAWPTLEQAAAKSDAVLIGRVVARKTLSDPRPYEGRDVGYVDLEVTEAIKGVAPRSLVRVWDAGFGSDCSVDFRPLETGTVVAMAVNQNRAEYREYQQVMRFMVAPTDYLLSSCGDYMRRLKSEAEASDVAKHLRKAAVASLKGRRTTR
jgi:hypothetical protein